MSKTNHSIIVEIAGNGTQTTARNQYLDPGEYSHVEVVNLKAAEPSQPVQIEITDKGNVEIQSMISVKSLERGTGEFFPSKAPIRLQNINEVNIKLQATAALDANGAMYQVTFWKKPDCNN